MGKGCQGRLWHGAEYSPAPGWLYGRTATQGVCGRTVAAHCCWDGVGGGEVRLASFGSNAFIFMCWHPCALPACPAPQPSAAVPENSAFCQWTVVDIVQIWLCQKKKFWSFMFHLCDFGIGSATDPTFIASILLQVTTGSTSFVGLHSSSLVN